MGKTTLLFHLLEKFRTSAPPHSFSDACNSREFMRFPAAELDTVGRSDFVRITRNQQAPAAEARPVIALS